MTEIFHSTPQHQHTVPILFPDITPLREGDSSSCWCSDWSMTNGENCSGSSDNDSSISSSAEDDIFNYLSISSQTSNSEVIQREIHEIPAEISHISNALLALSQLKDCDNSELLMLTPNPLTEPAVYDIRDNSPDNSSDDYMWDYEREFLLNKSQTSFVAFHPEDFGVNEERNCFVINYNCSTFDHVRTYIEICCNTNINDSVVSKRGLNNLARVPT